ncbi:ABC transporter substrate-binding protein [Frankia sp. CNm7]|uniref:Thiamine pyrimidine synthase n=1 Tax=Frankia nepalensis TaxID=1836974 RepID=A0A937US50_9ACTN|nr:ABC transporter substrate-binding protein [Frankia nepalensis]MBL7497246.1 ABC transporter substrate-binding protein [Frankia nepalensis]MBL7512948.1 ABC transporter substrate-binding protein [Frankia nepalensis]MBL7522623.1 ABC transporter substrate-binding protein [Frankia nepalensis]MBL7633494.1 ABC transporter substrate-binding protein [Frankia nepalensis]
MKRRLAGGLAAVLAGTLVLAACGDDDTTGEGGGGAAALTPVKLQLQWAYQAQFAGYIAARDKGFFEEEGLDVELLEAAVDTPPHQVLADGGADFAIAWVPKALQIRESGAEITNIAQIFQRSGTLQVSFKDKGINAPADLAGKKVGNWGFGNEYELFAAMTEAGIDPSSGVTLVQQDFNMNALLSGDIDAAQAMSYNEYAQVLEAENPATGELYKPEDFTVLDWDEVGTAMLQDSIWADTEKLEDPAYQDTATKIIKASIKGWVYCRDNPEECRDLVVAAGSKLGASHQLWQMNEVNQLIWPSPDGIGTLDEAAWKQTVEIAKATKNADGDTVLTKDPEGLAYTTDYVTKALEELRGEGVDVTGTNYKPITVTLEPGGV